MWRIEEDQKTRDELQSRIRQHNHWIKIYKNKTHVGVHVFFFSNPAENMNKAFMELQIVVKSCGLENENQHREGAAEGDGALCYFSRSRSSKKPIQNGMAKLLHREKELCVYPFQIGIRRKTQQLTELVRVNIYSNIHWMVRKIPQDIFHWRRVKKKSFKPNWKVVAIRQANTKEIQHRNRSEDVNAAKQKETCQAFRFGVNETLIMRRGTGTPH